MYTVLNDISATPLDVNIPDNWSLIKRIIDISSYLSEKYSLDRLIVPYNFVDIKIAGGNSINNHRASHPYDIDKLIILESFLANRISNDDAELLEIANANNNGNPIDVYIGTQNSTLLAGVYVLRIPTISFQSHSTFMVDKLDCEFVSLDADNKITSRQVQIDNIHDETGYNFHRKLLSKIKQQIKFANLAWDASKSPCWNTEIIVEIMKEFNYPQSISGHDLQLRRGINMKVADVILISNGWEEDRNVKNLNNHRQEIWRIYRAKSSRHEVYISVDLGEGEFELQDRRGKWIRTVFFDGRDTGKDYSRENTHNINLR